MSNRIYPHPIIAREGWPILAGALIAVIVSWMLDPGIIQLAFNRKNARRQNESAGGGSYRVLSLSLNLFRLFLFSINRPAREDPVKEAALAA